MHTYHTDVQPIDASGAPIKPLDLLIIGEIPEDYSDAEDHWLLKKYEGRFGLVTYHRGDGRYYVPHRSSAKVSASWTSRDGSYVNVRTVRVAEDGSQIRVYEFLLKASAARVIPYNYVIMSLFAEYPWEMQDEDGPSSNFFITPQLPEFERLKFVIESDYSQLVKAHELVVAALEGQ